MNGLTANAEKLKSRISQYEQGLEKSSREADALLVECLASTLAPTEELLIGNNPASDIMNPDVCVEFGPTSDHATRVQRIAGALSHKYQAIAHFWESHKEEPSSLETREDSLKEVWSVSRAVAVLESEVYQHELAQILDTVSIDGTGSSVEHLDTEEMTPSVVEAVEKCLEWAGKLDRLERVKRENNLLVEVSMGWSTDYCLAYTGRYALEKASYAASILPLHRTFETSNTRQPESRPVRRPTFRA